MCVSARGSRELESVIEHAGPYRSVEFRFERSGARDPAMSASKDLRLLGQCERALHRVSDWLNDLETVSIDGRHHDDLGELIHAVDEARDEAEAARP